MYLQIRKGAHTVGINAGYKKRSIDDDTKKMALINIRPTNSEVRGKKNTK
jgi:hypothetical protein